MTFSLAGRCARTGMFGVVVSSSSPAVAARCAYARAGVGAVTTQNVTDPRLGPRLLDAMQSGLGAPEAMRQIVSGAEFASYRQLSAVDAQGRTASYSGAKTLGTHCAAEGIDGVAAGNLLASPDVPASMVAAFEAGDGDDLGDRLIAGLRAAVAAGGEEGPVHSAGLVLVDRVSWYIADLRVDWSEDPIEELAQLWLLWKPQMNDYLTRALDPTAAPSYGVPGDSEDDR